MSISVFTFFDLFHDIVDTGSDVLHTLGRKILMSVRSGEVRRFPRKVRKECCVTQTPPIISRLSTMATFFPFLALLAHFCRRPDPMTIKSKCSLAPDAQEITKVVVVQKTFDTTTSFKKRQ
jgi:hypothetical protein